MLGRQKKMTEAVYSIQEFAANAGSLFNKGPECVCAALKSTGRTKFTQSEAQKIVELFLKKEVK